MQWIENNTKENITWRLFIFYACYMVINLEGYWIVQFNTFDTNFFQEISQMVEVFENSCCRPRISRTFALVRGVVQSTWPKLVLIYIITNLTLYANH